MRSRVLLSLAASLIAALAISGTAREPVIGLPEMAASDTDSVFIRASAEALAHMKPCTVERVVDGDTIRCVGLGRVRLLLIDAPERDQGEWAARSSDALAGLLPVGATVHLETDIQERDRFGRLLAYIYLPEGVQVNELMVRMGYAVVVSYPPNVRHIDPLRRARSLAQVERRGLWSTNAFDCTPRDHRGRKCE